MNKSKKIVALILALAMMAVCFAGCAGETSYSHNWSAKGGDPKVEPKATADTEKLVAFGSYPNTLADKTVSNILNQIVIDPDTGLYTEYDQANLDGEGTGTKTFANYDMQTGYYVISVTTVTANVDGEVVTKKYAKVDNKYYFVQEIQWIVAEVSGNNYILISKEAIDARAYNNEFVETTWETSSLKAWLSGTGDYAIGGAKYATEWNFANRAFDASEKSAITGEITILNSEQFNKYFVTNQLGGEQCTCTPFASARGVVAEYSKRGCSWWLQDAGIDTYFQGVDRNGTIAEGGYKMNDATIGVRVIITVSKDATRVIDETLPTAGPLATSTPKPAKATDGQ